MIKSMNQAKESDMNIRDVQQMIHGLLHDKDTKRVEGSYVANDDEEDMRNNNNHERASSSCSSSSPE